MGGEFYLGFKTPEDPADIYQYWNCLWAIYKYLKSNPLCRFASYVEEAEETNVFVEIRDSHSRRKITLPWKLEMDREIFHDVGYASRDLKIIGLNIADLLIYNTLTFDGCIDEQRHFGDTRQDIFDFGLPHFKPISMRKRFAHAHCDVGGRYLVSEQPIKISPFDPSIIWE